MAELRADLRVLQRRYAISPETERPDRCGWYVYVEFQGPGEPAEMDILRREYGWRRVREGRYEHAVLGPTLYIPIPLDQR